MGLRRGWETFWRSTATDATSRLVPFAARRLRPLRPRPAARSTLRSEAPIAASGPWAGESRGRPGVFGKQEAASRHFFFGPDEARLGAQAPPAPDGAGRHFLFGPVLFGQDGARGRVGAFGQGRVGQARPAPDRRLR